MPVLAAVSVGRIWVIERRPSAVVLSMGGREPAPRVVAEVRARGDGSEVEVHLAESNNTNDGVLATGLAGFALLIGMSMLNGSASFFSGYLVFIGLLSIMSLIGWRRSAARARQADFKAIAQAIDDALREFKPGEQGAVYRVGAGKEPAGALGGKVDDGLGVFRSRGRRSR